MNARLDVTAVLRNPMFADTIDIVRSTETVDNHGIVSFSPTNFNNVVAVVTQSNGDIIRRQQAGEHIEGTIAVYTKFTLIAGAPGTTADIVTYPARTGRKYTVTKISDYSRWGAGFTCAICELIPLSG